MTIFKVLYLECYKHLLRLLAIRQNICKAISYTSLITKHLRWNFINVFNNTRVALENHQRTLNQLTMGERFKVAQNQTWKY